MDPTGTFYLSMQGDGNLVSYYFTGSNIQGYWATNTNFFTNGPKACVYMRPNFAVTDSGNSIKWQVNGNGIVGGSDNSAVLSMQ